MSRFVATFDDWEYAPDDYDILVAGVALYGETRGYHSSDEWVRMLWTWMNRFMLHDPRPRVWPTLADLVEAHSQPVNPLWREGGSRCPYPVPGGNCDPERLTWRANMADLISQGFQGLDALPAEQYSVVSSFFDGFVSQPETVDGSPLVDFGMTSAAKKHGTRYEPRGNYYLTREQVKNTKLVSNFMGGTVVPERQSGELPEDYYDQVVEEASPTPYILGGAAIAAAAFLLKKTVNL